MIKYANHALFGGLAFFIVTCTWSLLYTQHTNERDNALRQQYGASCNKQGGVAIAPNGMYQCIKWEVK